MNMTQFLISEAMGHLTTQILIRAFGFCDSWDMYNIIKVKETKEKNLGFHVQIPYPLETNIDL